MIEKRKKPEYEHNTREKQKDHKVSHAWLYLHDHCLWCLSDLVVY